MESWKQVDSGENAGAERDRAPSKRQEQQAGALPSAATRGHWFPLLELHAAALLSLWACPSPSRASVAKRFIVSLSPGANTDLVGERRTPHRTSSILPGKAGGWDPGSGTQPSLSGNCSEHTRDEMAQHPWLPSVPRLCSLASFAEEQPQGAPSLSLAWQARCHCSFLLCIGIQDWEDSPLPKPALFQTLSTLFKSSKV